MNKQLQQTTAQKLVDLQTDQLRKLSSGEITVDHIEWFNDLATIQRDKLMSDHKPMVLELLSETITTTCDESLYDGPGSVFDVWVYKLVQGAQFTKMFESLGIELNKLCLSEIQIREFCSKHPEQLNSDGYTFFLFKKEKDSGFFVKGVSVTPAESKEHFFEGGITWSGDRGTRVVVAK